MRRRQRERPQAAAGAVTGGPRENARREFAIEVRRRLESGDALADVARWLYLGPADRQATIAVKALVYGSGLRLAECVELIDGVIAEIAPEHFQQTLALRVDFTKAMDGWADELRRDEHHA